LTLKVEPGQTLALVGASGCGKSTTVALIEKKVEILFPVVKELKTIKKFLKKDKEKGWFYETNY